MTTLTKERFDQIEPGRLMCACDGPGQYPTPEGAATVGTVVGKFADRWGYHLVVHCTDGRLESAEDAMDPAKDKRIGWYLLPDTEQEARAPRVTVRTYHSRHLGGVTVPEE